MLWWDQRSTCTCQCLYSWSAPAGTVPRASYRNIVEGRGVKPPWSFGRTLSRSQYTAVGKVACDDVDEYFFGVCHKGDLTSHANTVEMPWESRKRSMKAPCKSTGSLMEPPWDSDGDLLTPWESHDCSPWTSHGAPTAASKPRGRTVRAHGSHTGAWKPHGSLMEAP